MCAVIQFQVATEQTRSLQRPVTHPSFCARTLRLAGYTDSGHRRCLSSRSVSISQFQTIRPFVGASARIAVESKIKTIRRRSKW